MVGLNCSCSDSKSKDNLITINNVNNKIKSMPGHYVESSKDNFSDYYKQAKAGQINSLSNSPDVIENDALKINYGKGEKGKLNKMIARGYGTYHKNSPDSELGKKNFDFDIVTLSRDGLDTYNNSENILKYRPKEIRYYEGEQSVTELINNEITAYKNLDDQDIIDQGKFMRESIFMGKIMEIL